MNRHDQAVAVIMEATGQTRAQAEGFLTIMRAAFIARGEIEGPPVSDEEFLLAYDKFRGEPNDTGGAT